MLAMTVQSNLKKYKKLVGYKAMAATTNSFIKHLSLRFNFSEFELQNALRTNKIRIYVSGD